MADILEKLRPDQDLQCYFERPTAIAAMSKAGPTGFVVSGNWRQQFDWAVVEWNRDNVFEHPRFRNLPDGDLSGLTLSYDEQRVNCTLMDSDVFPSQPWPYLRVWTDSCGADPYLVSLREYATPIEGSYIQAWCEFELSGTVSQDDFVGLAFCGEHYTHQNYYDDTLESIIQQIGLSINSSSKYLTATWDGARIRLEAKASVVGTNGNRLGVYSYVGGAVTERWSDAVQTLHDGESPTKWHIELPFGQFPFPMTSVRKMRWTYAADLQKTEFARMEFSVEVSNWTVSGENRTFSVGGSGTRRIENAGPEVSFGEGWVTGYGNFSGGSIAHTSTPGGRVTVRFNAAQDHDVFLGTRLSSNGAPIQVSIDGGEMLMNLGLAGEDSLARISLGSIESGSHEVSIRHAGSEEQTVYFDFLELVVACDETFDACAKDRETLATDWDTDHAIALPAERTARMLKNLGFNGRANHYVGALWFYELCPSGFLYAVTRVRFAGTPVVDSIVAMELADSRIEHLVHPGDTAETIATALGLRLNQGFTSVWAEVSGGELMIQSRALGTAGNAVMIAVSGGGSEFSITVEPVQSGVDGVWRTDLNALPRLNRAARDWTRAYLTALHAYGIDAVCAFSMELQHGDPSSDAGIAQRYPSGNPVQLQTPAIQTNFSPASLAFWTQVYADCAQLMTDAGVKPYLQFGEVQWWYFPYDGSGMPFCDAFTDQVFLEKYGRAARRIANEQVDPADYQDELTVYQGLVGEFTAEIIQFVREKHADCRFEVLYPTDVNATALNRAANFPIGYWTPSNVDCLKTESFTYTAQRDLNRARSSILFGTEVGFAWTQRSHLVGISDPTTPWRKEVAESVSDGVESVVLFALDQYCLIGYDPSGELRTGGRASYSEL